MASLAYVTAEAPPPLAGPAGQAYRLLHAGFTVLPIIAGVDKFFDFLVPWGQYLAPALARLMPLTVEAQMRLGGIAEIAAGLLVAVRPRWGGYLVAGWLWAIIANLLLLPGYYDIALRDFGLSLGALALARLAAAQERWREEPLVEAEAKSLGLREEALAGAEG